MNYFTTACRRRLQYIWPVFLILNIVCMLALFFSIPHKIHTPSNSDNTNISHRLDDIQGQLIGMQHDLKKPTEKIDFSGINQDVKKLASSIEQLKAKDETQLNQLLKDTHSKLATKLDGIYQIMHTLDEKHHPITYLPASALPFQIISIDSIQQVNVASVRYDYKIVPLEKKDSLAGWTVLSLDFSQQKIELENSNKERVVIALEGVEQDV